MELGISTLGHNIEFGITHKNKYKGLTDLFLDATEACLKLSEEQGFKVCEIIIESPDLFINEIKREFIDICDSYSIKKQVHGPFIDMGLCSHNNLISMASVDAYVKAAELSEDIKAKIFTIHPGVANFLINSLHGYNKKQLIKAVKVLLDKIAAIDLTICMENMTNSCHIIGTDKEMIQFFEDIQREDLYMTYDTSHAWTCNMNVENLWEKLHNRIKNIHLVDNFETTSDTHPRLGSGKIDFEQIFDIIRKYHYEGSLIIELSSATETLKSIEYIKPFI
jgi:sugar phosphate isomerase/epimerase